METVEQEIVNNFNGMEVHAINPNDFGMPMDLRNNFQRVNEDKGKCSKTIKTKVTEVRILPSYINPAQLYDIPQYVHTVDKKQEVMKAAKSVFSKRTLTLYHWVCTNVPKAQLKAFVAAQWNTLPAMEKQFYISQVLGKFGLSESGLMVNPQLGGIAQFNMEVAQNVPKYDGSPQSGSVQNSLSSPTMNIPSVSRFLPKLEQNTEKVVPPKGGKRRGRPPGSTQKAKKARTVTTAIIRTTTSAAGGVAMRPAAEVDNKSNVAVTEEDFRDDPELHLEFEQFNFSLNTST